MERKVNSKYYKEKYGSAWAQYDPALANQLLDEMGLTKGSDGIRLRPDGKPLSYMIEQAGIRVGASVAEFCEMIITYWREIGIDATVKQIDEQLYGERMTAPSKRFRKSRSTFPNVIKSSQSMRPEANPSTRSAAKRHSAFSAKARPAS